MTITKSQSVPRRGDNRPRARLLDLMTADRRIAVLLCPKPAEIGREATEWVQTGFGLPPLCIQSPLDVTSFLAGWCGSGNPPDETIAKLLLDRARLLLQIARSAESVPERRWQVESVHDPKASDGAVDFARLLLAIAPGNPVEIVRQALMQLGERGLSDAEQCQIVAQSWGAGHRPILIVASGQIQSMVETIRWLATIAEAVPEMRLLVVVDLAAWDCLQKLLGSHVVAILRDGITFFTDISRDRRGENGTGASVSSALTDASGSFAASRERVRQGGPCGTTSVEQLRVEAHRALEIAQRINSPPPGQLALPDEHAVARSLAEALLYAALQAGSMTTGLFKLNADGGFAFGNQAAEIDLLCSSLAIAIEIDGYFHFQDKEAYRRDRAKDWLMQRAGMTVLRFLAEDVIERLEFVVERVNEVVTRRRSQGTGGVSGASTKAGGK